MSINSIGNNQPLQQASQSTVRRSVPSEAPAQLPVSDRLELSGISHFLKALKTNDVRADKVASIKSQIENGTYEDDAKLNVATDRLLDDLDL